MTDPSILTIIARVRLNCIEPLTKFLLAEINPDEHGRDRTLKFGAYPNLHFCSFSITDDCGPDRPAQLVFEATFDGPQDSLIRDLVSRDPDILIAIYRHCDGFPAAARENPQLVELFLQQHSIATQAFFSGAPGRSVRQIKTERAMRRRVQPLVENAPKDLLGAEPRRLQDYLRRAFLADQELSHAMQPPEAPWSVRNGHRILMQTGRIAYAVFFLFGLALFWADLFGAASFWRDLVALPIDRAAAALVATIGGLFVLSILRGVGIDRHRAVNPCAWPQLLLGLTAAAAILLRILALIWSVRITVAVGVWLEGWITLDGLAWPVEAILWLGSFVVLYIPVLLLWPVRKSGDLFAHAGRWVQFLREGPGAFVGFIVFRIALFVSLAPVAALATMVWSGWVWGAVTPFAGYLIWAMGATSVGLIVIIALWLLFLAGHEILMAREHSRLPAEPPEREHRSDRLDVWEREEHGQNRRQNHYISLTDVKPFRLRRWILRLMLMAVNFIARYKDNKGNLGGITTIFSARWVLIDEGRRLLFLTNYSGAWDSYLNEFSELASVVGVNMIWTNTWIAPKKDEAAGQHFPRTRLFIGRGARSTLPFKAYVRRSQIETLVWYGAYRDLSVINVVENARMRDAIFGETDAAGLDHILKRASS